MVKWKLFIIFLKIGLYSFGGGYAVIPLIEKSIINENSWISYGSFKEMITISQLTPGPLAVNISTFVGYYIDSYPGAIIATIATLIPGLLILVFLIKVFDEDTRNHKLAVVLQSLSLFAFLLITIASINIIKIYSLGKTFPVEDLIFIAVFSFLSLKKKLTTFHILLFGFFFGLIKNII